MKTNFGSGLAATAAIALFAALALLPAATAGAPGDISRTFYRQEPGYADLKDPGIGFFGVSDPAASACIVALTGGQLFPPAELFVYFEQDRIYTNVKAGFTTIPAIGAVGPVFACPALLLIGPEDPVGYQLYIGGINVAATLDHIHMSELVGTQQPLDEQQIPTASEWDIGVCKWSDAVFTLQTPNDEKGAISSITGSLPAPLNQITASKAIKCGASNNLWVAVREADPRLTSPTTGDLQTDEVLATTATGGPYYFVSCVQTTVSTFTPPSTVGTRTAISHDWALVVGAGDAPADIVAAILNHKVGPSAPRTIEQGMYDLSGDNGNPCDAAGAPADTPLLAKK
ncbi:MAG TPA: hypothetical protein VM241_04150 [Candidatus Thermoplasmatota archaeon]|nr:hypothetical protein [Candidatus Thermoplasmatota archaeon]